MVTGNMHPLITTAQAATMNALITVAGERQILDRPENLGKGVAERSKEPSFRRPVCYGEYNVRERPLKIVFKGPAEIQGSAMGIGPKGATAPGAENQRPVSIG